MNKKLSSFKPPHKKTNLSRCISFLILFSFYDSQLPYFFIQGTLTDIQGEKN